MATGTDSTLANTRRARRGAGRFFWAWAAVRYHRRGDVLRGTWARLVG